MQKSFSMNEATQKVINDLSVTKAWHNVIACFNNQLKIPYLIARESPDALQTIVIALRCGDDMSHEQLLSVFNSLSPPGDLNSFEDGLLLALVGVSSTVVYHRILPGIANVLPKLKSSREPWDKAWKHINTTQQ